MEGTSKSIVEKMTKFENLPKNLMNFLPYSDATKSRLLSKAFHSQWLSCPVLDFDYRFHEKNEDSDHRFFSFILNTLPHINKSLQKFRLYYVRGSFMVEPFRYQHVIDMLLNFVIENKSKEIVFDIWLSRLRSANVRHVEPLRQLFSADFLTVLKLTGLRLPIADPIICCPELKELLMLRCKGLRTITVSSPSVDKVEILGCFGLEGVQVPNAKNLSCFSLAGYDENTIRASHFDLPACESVKYFSLFFVKVSKCNLTEPVTEQLHISDCHLPENFRIHNSKVKELKMFRVFNLENLFLFTPNLERFSFSYGIFGISTRQRCTMDNISACVALTALELQYLPITDEWFKSVIQNLSSLKELKLFSCLSIRKIELKNEKLEKLTLAKCSDLKEAIVESPNLLKFDYVGSLQVYPLVILSTKCRVSMDLPNCRIDPILWFANMNQFLSCFDHIQLISITLPRAEDLMFTTEHVSGNNPFPLRDLKYMKVRTNDEPDTQNVIKMIEGLLWLVPKPLQLTLVAGSPNLIIRTLMFKYGKEVASTMDECFGIPTKCWRHYELKVDIQGFNDSETRDLNKFFDPYMH